MLFKMMFFIIQKYQKDPIQKFKKLILGSLYIKYTYYKFINIYYAIFFCYSNSLSVDEIIFSNFICKIKKIEIKFL